MTVDIKVSVGLDLHKKFILGTVLWQTGQMIQERFDRTKEGLFSLKAWVMGHHADVVACESTSDYWVQVYDLLNGIIPVIVGNAHDIKVLSHRKTDKIDSEMIARLALHGMIQPSRVFAQKHREFRKLIRLRHALVQKRTDIKNQIHHILDSVVASTFGGNFRSLWGLWYDPSPGTGQWNPSGRTDPDASPTD
jgi:transposase